VIMDQKFAPFPMHNGSPFAWKAYFIHNECPQVWKPHGINASEELKIVPLDNLITRCVEVTGINDKNWHGAISEQTNAIQGPFDKVSKSDVLTCSRTMSEWVYTSDVRKLSAMQDNSKLGCPESRAVWLTRARNNARSKLAVIAA
jgi:hypothetical protein